MCGKDACYAKPRPLCPAYTACILYPVVLLIVICGYPLQPFMSCCGEGFHNCGLSWNEDAGTLGLVYKTSFAFLPGHLCSWEYFRVGCTGPWCSCTAPFFVVILYQQLTQCLPSLLPSLDCWLDHGHSFYCSSILDIRFHFAEKRTKLFQGWMEEYEHHMHTPSHLLQYSFDVRRMGTTSLPFCRSSLSKSLIQPRKKFTLWGYWKFCFVLWPKALDQQPTWVAQLVFLENKKGSENLIIPFRLGEF